MVFVVLPSLPDASALQIVGAVVLATALAYKLLGPRPAHERFAKKHGLTNVKQAKRLPNSRFLIGDLLEIAENATRFPDWLLDKVLEINEQPFVRSIPLAPDSIMVCTPELVEDVYKTQNDIMGKGEQLAELFDDLIGESFSMRDGETWFHQRKISSKFSSVRMYREVATRMINKHTEKFAAVLMQGKVDGKQVNLSKLFSEFTLQTFAELGFGLEMDFIGSEKGHPLNEALVGALPQILYRLQTPSWIWKLQRFLNIGSERKYAETTRYIRELVMQMVSKSIEQSKLKPREEAATIVELFIHAMEDGETNVTPKIMGDDAIAFAIAGRDTTADTLNWFFLMLSWHPEVEKKLRRELDEKLPELMSGKIKVLTMEQTQGLTYLEAVIKETLRLYPPVPLSLRQAQRDTVLVDGTFVPKGYTVGISPYVMGRLESVWGPDARTFKPERFIDSQTGKLLTVSSFKFNSFQGGPRICIGMNLAMLEMKLLIATLLSRFHLEIEPNDGSYTFSASLSLKNSLIARVRPSTTSGVGTA